MGQTGQKFPLSCSCRGIQTFYWRTAETSWTFTYPGLDQTLGISKLGIAEATRDQERRQIKVWSLISINTERLKVQGHGVNPLERGLKQLSKS